MTGGGSLALGRPHASCFLAQLCTVKLRLGRRRETSGPKFRYLALGCPDLGQDLKDARSAGILQSPRVPEGGSTSKKKKKLPRRQQGDLLEDGGDVSDRRSCRQ